MTKLPSLRLTMIGAVLIAVASSALGLAVNAMRRDTDKEGNARRLPWVAPPPAALLPQDQILLEEARALWSTGAGFFLDARAPVDYAAGHIAGAINLPVEAFPERYPQVAAFLTPDSPIVAYCNGVECDLSHDLALKLRQLGYKNVRILVNGWNVWSKAGLPISTGENP
jgi:rhodanese-related sulfurtransferase